MRDRNGDTVDPWDVLDGEELADAVDSFRSRFPTTGYEGVSLGADPAVVAWHEAMVAANTNDEHLERGEN